MQGSPNLTESLQLDSGSDEEDECYCSYALTGLNKIKQPLYICHDCSPDAHNCFCEGCASVCHADHNVEYVTNGLGNCDCAIGSFGTECSLIEKSREKAEQLFCESDNYKHHDKVEDERIYIDSKVEQPSPIKFAELHRIRALTEPCTSTTGATPSIFNNIPEENEKISSTILDTPTGLQSPNDLQEAISSACHELIKHTKETHWLPYCDKQGIFLNLLRKMYIIIISIEMI